MRTAQLDQLTRAVRRPMRLALLATAAVASTCLAADPAYNPYHLSAAEIAKVATICQNVMGLHPDAELTDNLWPADPDPARSTNDFRGCTAALSSSLQRAAAARQATQAEQDCRSLGLTDGSSELAMCMLKAEQAATPARPIQLAALSVTPFLAAATAGPSGHASATLRREQQSCAELGLDPREAEFARCVQGLTRVMSARFMQDLYRNVP